MSNVRNYILSINYDKEKAVGFATSTANDLESNRSTLIEVVQSLAEFINDEDSSIRSRAVEYLSEVVKSLPVNFLSRQQTRVLCQFLCDRIEDGGAIPALAQLQGNENFNGEMALMVFRALINYFQDLQLRPQAQRFQILELLNALMFRHRNALKEIGTESLVGIVDLVGGEKDPRNLMVIFSILKVVMIEWDISDHAELLFDAIFCYFPITFRPPPNDPYGITAQDLKARLRKCIAANGLFAPYAFPQLIDKMDDTSPNVKKDVMQTICACATSYSKKGISKFSITLWESLKFEILNPQEDDLAEEALKSLQLIAIRLSESSDTPDSDGPLGAYLQPIIKECIDQLQEPTHKQAKPAGKILATVGATSPTVLARMVKDVLPSLDVLYQAADSIAKQRALLEVVVQLLESTTSMYGAMNFPATSQIIDNPLIPFKARFFELSSQALMSTAAGEVSFRIAGLRVLLLLCMLQGYLQNDEMGIFVQYLNEIILSDDQYDRSDLKMESIQALVKMSAIKPQLIMDITLPAFMARLPDSAGLHDHGFTVTLESLAQLSKSNFISATLVRRLLSKLDVVLQNGGSHEYQLAILSALNYILSGRDLRNDSNLGFYHEKLVVGLISRTTIASARRQPSTALNDVASLEMLGRLVVKIVQALDQHKQNSVALQVYSLFTDETDYRPILFRNTASQLERSTMILSTYLMAGVNSKATLQFSEQGDTFLRDLLTELVRLALSEDSASIRQAILRQVGLLANKFLPFEKLNFAMEMMSNLVTDMLEARNSSENAVRVVFWIGKALISRLFRTEQILERLLMLLSNGRWSLPTARGFALLLAPDEVLCKENGAIIRLLAKQKVFNACVPTMAQRFRNADTDVKPNFLIALSGILKFMPTEVTMPEIDTILPLLLQSLELEDSNVKVATLQSLALVSQDSPKTVEGHMGSLVSRLLRAANNGKANTVSVRLSALRCLSLFPGKVKDSDLIPYRNMVMRRLLTVLDDPKRQVRREAVECRAIWSNMDQPQSD